MVRTTVLLLLLGGVLRFSTAGHPTALEACYVALWRLPRPDLHRQVNDDSQGTPASARCGPCRASAATMPAANALAVSTCGRLRRRSLQSGHRATSAPRPPSFESDAMGGLPVLVDRASHS